jgi:hypothetical protein
LNKSINPYEERNKKDANKLPARTNQVNSQPDVCLMAVHFNWDVSAVAVMHSNV